MCAGELEAPDETLIGALIKHEVVRRVTQVLLGLKTHPVSISQNLPRQASASNSLPQAGRIAAGMAPFGRRILFCFAFGLVMRTLVARRPCRAPC